MAIVRYLFIAACVLLVASLAGAQGILNGTFVVEGQLLDMADSTPVPYAHAYTSDFRRFEVTGENGRFIIQLTTADTLVISSVGYAKRHLIFADIPASRKIKRTIYMSQNPLQLPGITIYGKPLMEGFYDHHRIPYDNFEERKLEKKYYTPDLFFDSASGTPGMSGLVTLLAAQFNSKYQQLKKLEKIKEKEYKEEYYGYLLRKRLSSAFVIGHTSFLHEEVEEFVKFWQPDTAFMEHATEYELVSAMKEKERQYIEKTKKGRGNKEDMVSTIELRKLLKE